jgi:DNA modification methylase
MADLIMDVTPIGGVVLGTFLGSGSTILGAHESKRHDVGIELDPKYVDVAILRLEKAIGKPAIHQSGKTFAELSADRRRETEEDF